MQEINENLNFDEQILDAAKSIMNAASALITAATSAQKDLVAQGKVSLDILTSSLKQAYKKIKLTAARYNANSDKLCFRNVQICFLYRYHLGKSY